MMRLTTAMKLRAAAWQEYLDAAPPHWPISIHPVALAKADCTYCRGVGIDRGTAKVRRIRPELCGCVYRQIFRICLRRYQMAQQDVRTLASIEVGIGAPNCTRPTNEYIADFELLANRRLPAESVHRLLFVEHFLHGQDYKFVHALANRQGHAITAGQVWHAIYQLQEWLGMVFATVHPHRLYPLDEYFGVNTAGLRQVSGGCSTPKQILPFYQESAEVDVMKRMDWPMPKRTQLNRRFADAA